MKSRRVQFWNPVLSDPCQCHGEGEQGSGLCPVCG